jgi:thioredoxin reductase
MNERTSGASEPRERSGADGVPASERDGGAAGAKPPGLKFDVLIVGAGPAGMSAALVLGRACRTVLMFDHGQPRNAATQTMHGFLTRDGIAPDEFRQIARRELARYESVRLESAVVKSVARLDGDGFEATLADGRSFTSRKMLLATGVVDNVPDVPGLRDLYGKSVFHCPFCDGFELRGRPIAVYGCERRGFGLSMEMLGWSKDLVLVSDGPCGIGADELATLARNGIRLREERVIRLEGGDGKLEHVVFAQGDPLAREALFFTTGQHMSCELAKTLGCQFNEKGTVHTGRHESTHVPGLYVAGDASRDVQWVVIAAAEGAEAAFAITQDLIKESWK